MENRCRNVRRLFGITSFLKLRPNSLNVPTGCVTSHFIPGSLHHQQPHPGTSVTSTSTAKPHPRGQPLEMSQLLGDGSLRSTAFAVRCSPTLGRVEAAISSIVRRRDIPTTSPNQPGLKNLKNSKERKTYTCIKHIYIIWVSSQNPECEAPSVLE